MDEQCFGDRRGGSPRDYLALALDLDDSANAVRLAESLVAHFRVAKVGLELYSACGPAVVGMMRDLGYDVFCDLKLHDIPTTVGKAARVIAELGASYLTVHAAGGLDMLRAGIAGLAEGSGASGGDGIHADMSEDVGSARGGGAMTLAVTVLTSEGDVSEGLLERRMAVAAAAGCAGIVCAAPDLAVAARVAGNLFKVVPGTRLPGDPLHDQSRTAAPAEARIAGADLLVVGRSVTLASDPVVAADRLHAHLHGQACR